MFGLYPATDGTPGKIFKHEGGIRQPVTHTTVPAGTGANKTVGTAPEKPTVTYCNCREHSKELSVLLNIDIHIYKYQQILDLTNLLSQLKRLSSLKEGTSRSIRTNGFY